MKKLFIIGLVGLTLLGTGCGGSKRANLENNTEAKVEEQIPQDIEIEEDNLSIYEGKVDDEPRVNFEDLALDFQLQAPDSIGTVYGIMKYTNNSNYPILNLTITVLDNTTNEKYYYSSYETVVPGDTSPNFESFGSNNMTPLTLEFTIYDKETMLGCRYEIDFKLETITWSSWSSIWAY